jgi:integrase
VCRQFGLADTAAAWPPSVGGRDGYGHRDATMTLLAYRHGLRAAELVDLRWDQIRQGRPARRRVKNGTPATHPILGDELCALRRTRAKARGPLLKNIAPKLARRMLYDNNVRTLMDSLRTSGHLTSTRAGSVFSSPGVAVSPS